jgi:hypothetical protein
MQCSSMAKKEFHLPACHSNGLEYSQIYPSLQHGQHHDSPYTSQTKTCPSRNHSPSPSRQYRRPQYDLFNTLDTIVFSQLTYTPGPPRKPSLHPVPSAIITATEKGMISENLLCSSLPSPVLRRTTHSKSNSTSSEEEWSYFSHPHSEVRTSSIESHNRPRHESERVDGMCASRENRGSLERSIRWKGLDV